MGCQYLQKRGSLSKKDERSCSRQREWQDYKGSLGLREQIDAQPGLGRALSGPGNQRDTSLRGGLQTCQAPSFSHFEEAKERGEVTHPVGQQTELFSKIFYHLLQSCGPTSCDTAAPDSPLGKGSILPQQLLSPHFNVLFLKPPDSHGDCHHVGLSFLSQWNALFSASNLGLHSPMVLLEHNLGRSIHLPQVDGGP